MVNRIVILCAMIMAFSLIFSSFSAMPVMGQISDKTATVDKKTPPQDNEKTSVEDEKPVINRITSPAPDSGYRITLYSWFKRGGFFMWPLLILAAVGLGFVTERLIYFKKSNLNPREFIDELERIIQKKNISEVEDFCVKNDIVLSRIFLKGIRVRDLGFERVEKAISAAGSIEVTKLERGLNILSAVGNIAPLLGFLGTVSGMISAFQSIAQVDQVSARLVASGIYEALITTETGLLIAIPLLASYNYFVHRVESFISDIERIASDITENLVHKSA